MDAYTSIAKAGSKEQLQMEHIAQLMNDVIPEGTDGGIVLGALMLLLRIGFDSHFEDPEQRLAIYDELVNGNRSLLMKDAGIKPQ